MLILTWAVRNRCGTVKANMKTAMSYFNEDVFSILPDDLKKVLKFDFVDYRVNPEHQAVTSRIIKAVREGNNTHLQNMLIEAAYIRKFLG